jgi:ketosteroid isomerase-like protein
VPEPPLAEDSLAAAIEMVRRLTLEAAGEAGAAEESGRDRPRAFACAACGRENPAENRFCARCGVPLDPAVWGATRSPDTTGGPAKRGKGETAGEHHYHHHYHHHYFAGEGAEPSPVSLRPTASNPAPAIARSPEGAKRGSPIPSEPVSRSESAARKVSEHWALACNTRHLDDLVELYGPDAIVMRPNVPPIRGTSAIREFFVAVLDAGLGEVELEPLRTEFMGDVAYEAGRCKMLVPVAMGKRREERGKYLMVMTRQAGEWKVASDCWSSDVSLSLGTETGAAGGASATGGAPSRSNRNVP